MSTLTPAFTGSGGYATSQSFNTIKQYNETKISQFDVTNSVQVTFDVRTFNNLIGIRKDVNNIDIVSDGYYDSSLNVLLTDSLIVRSYDFIKGINMVGNSASPSNNILSVGSYSSFYQNFANYIASYFGLPSPSNPQAQGTSQGMATLYSNEYNFLPNNGIFDSAALLNFINGKGVQDGKGGYIDPLSGTIELQGITASLRNAVATNCFGNRNYLTGNTASDVTDRANYGVSDGFYDGDVIYIAGGGIYGDVSGNSNGDGILLTMKLLIDPVYGSQINNADVITRSLGNSLVIRLKNLSACLLTADYSTNTSSSLTFAISGTYENVAVARSPTGILANNDYVSYEGGVLTTTGGSPNSSTFVDSGLESLTTYHYSFTPIDGNLYTGVPHYIIGTTLSN
jgi:hypothetical protein